MIDEIRSTYNLIKNDILKRIKEFEENGRDEKKAFREMVFCLLTPQSKAEICWNAVLSMDDSLMDADLNEVITYLNGIRFKYSKAKYVIEARKKFWRNGKFILLQVMQKMDEKEARKWLVKNVKGYGFKEASHFLRNIGKGKNLAILDRHILRKLKKMRIIKEIPSSLTEKKYIEIEKKMGEFSSMLSIPLLHLDFVFWYMETGRIFK